MQNLSEEKGRHTPENEHLVAVKPLEWVVSEDRYRGSFRRQAWSAATGFGNYLISLAEDDLRKPGEFYLYADFPFRAEFYPTLEAANAAAQADYEQRIRSALVPTAALDLQAAAKSEGR